jgi:hypothetical protein
MRRWRLVAIVVLTVAGALAFVLANDVSSWRRTLGADAVAYSAAPGQPARLTAPTILPSGVSGRLLAVERDRQWLAALQQFVVTYNITEDADGLGPASYQLLHAGERALSKVTQDPDPARASQAYNLLAVLVFRSAYPGSGVDPGLIQEALSDLQNAVRVDKGDELAKENLELALRVLVAKHGVSLKNQGVGDKATRIRKGGQGGTPGSGY